MLLGLDQLEAFVLITAFTSFVLFLVAHIIALRYLRPASALRVLTRSFTFGFAVDAAAGIWPTVTGGDLMAGYARENILLGAGASASYTYHYHWQGVLPGANPARTPT